MQMKFAQTFEVVELVSNLNEGRLMYISAMAFQLSLMASAAGDEELAVQLGKAANQARKAAQKQLTNH